MKATPGLKVYLARILVVDGKRMGLMGLKEPRRFRPINGSVTGTDAFLCFGSPVTQMVGRIERARLGPQVTEISLPPPMMENNR
jgi:hypothetical protein